MIRDRNIAANAVIQVSKLTGFIHRPKTYYVDHKVGVSGDGSTWTQAFKTFKEAVTQVNTDYSAQSIPSSGRNRTIVVGEGFYSETPSTMTASDVYVIGVASGNHDSIVVYGSATAGGFDIGSGGPALTLTGDNCTVENMGFFTYDNTKPAIQNGALANASYGNSFINCCAARDVADGEIGGLLDYCAASTLVRDCFFSISCKDYGVKVTTDGVINPVDAQYINNRFVGTSIGILIGAGHNTFIHENWFYDDTSDVADTITTAVENNGTNSIFTENYWEFSDANAVTVNAGTMVNNHQLADV